MKRWCRSSEAARILGVSRSTVARLAEAGVLPARRFERSSWWQFDRQELQRLAGDALLTSMTRVTSFGHETTTLQYSGQGGSHGTDTD